MGISITLFSRMDVVVIVIFMILNNYETNCRIKKSTHRTNEQQVKVKYLESAFQTSLFPENKINVNISQQQNHRIKKSTHRTNEQQVKVNYLESAFQTSLFQPLLDNWK